MDIDMVSRNSALPAADPVIPPGRAAQNREVIQAIRAVNEAEMFGGENELEYRMDPATRKMVVRVVNRKSKEAIEEYSPEYILRAAETLKP
jgi:uncharacterized FlaG/YvyC family protein